MAPSSALMALASRIPKLLLFSGAASNKKLLIWQARVRPFLEAYDVWGYVSGAIPCPSTEPEVDEWKCRDGLAKDWLLNTISDDLPLKMDLRLLSTSKEIWDRLEQTFPPQVAAATDEPDHMNPENKSSLGTRRMSGYKLVTDDGLIVSKERGCYMISIMKCDIHLLEKKYERVWIPETRFPELVRFYFGHGQEIQVTAKIGRDMLFPKTSYKVNLVYRFIRTSNVFNSSPFLKALLWEDPTRRDEGRRTFFTLMGTHSARDRERIQEFNIETPRERDDGWLEVNMGHFSLTNIPAQASANYVEVHFTGNYESDALNVNSFANYLDIMIEGIEFKPM